MSRGSSTFFPPLSNVIRLFQPLPPSLEQKKRKLKGTSEATESRKSRCKRYVHWFKSSQMSLTTKQVALLHFHLIRFKCDVIQSLFSFNWTVSLSHARENNDSPTTHHNFTLSRLNSIPLTRNKILHVLLKNYNSVNIKRVTIH